MEKCPLCEDWCGPGSLKISRNRAAKTAHTLAKEKADAGMAGLNWLDVYNVFFPKIYIHELKRNLALEREIELEKSMEKNKDHPDICAYHCENFMWFDDKKRHAESKKEQQKDYDESKWPNKLSFYAEKIKVENL